MLKRLIQSLKFWIYFKNNKELKKMDSGNLELWARVEMYRQQDDVVGLVQYLDALRSKAVRELVLAAKNDKKPVDNMELL